VDASSKRWRSDGQGLINPNVSALGDWSLPAKKERAYRYRLVVCRSPATREQLQRGSKFSPAIRAMACLPGANRL
jgi:hypothetical protein